MRRCATLERSVARRIAHLLAQQGYASAYAVRLIAAIFPTDWWRKTWGAKFYVCNCKIAALLLEQAGFAAAQVDIYSLGVVLWVRLQTYLQPCCA